MPLIRYISQQNEDLKRRISQYKTQLILQVRKQMSSHLNQRQKNLLIRSSLFISPEKWVIYGHQVDFCVSVLNCAYDAPKWEAFQSLVKHCGWILCFEKLESPTIFKKMVIICDQPLKSDAD